MGIYSTARVMPSAVVFERMTGTCCPTWIRACRPSKTSTDGLDNTSASPACTRALIALLKRSMASAAFLSKAKVKDCRVVVP